jgi:hypothetical protein
VTAAAKFHEPELVDPRQVVEDDGETKVSYLREGDEIGCLDAGPGLFPVTAVDDAGADHYDITWVRLCNDPGTTTEVWGRPVPNGSVAIRMSGDHWKIMPIPRVLARRKVAS